VSLAEIVMSKKLLVCTNYRANPNNPSCAARGSKQIATELQLALEKNNVSIEIELSPCMGFCKIGPNLRLVPNGEFFHEVSTKKLPKIILATKKFTQ
jgi:NADH:ubiquinone oxidoreductase subunit E